MTDPVTLFFRITNRLFAFFMDFLGRLLRHSRRLDLSNTFRKRLLVVRQGGLGDLLFVSAVTAELKRQQPHLQVDLMCHPRYHAAFHGTGAINHLLDHRWPSITRLFGYDYFIFLDGVVESDPDANTTNIYDLLAGKYFGLPIADHDKKPALTASEGRKEDVLRKMPGLATAPLRVGLQLKANSPVRTPEPEVWLIAIESVLRRVPNAMILVIAEPGHDIDAETFVARVRTCTHCRNVVHTCRTTSDAGDLIALIAQLDIVIAPDSSVSHIAAAFDVPALGIYGPFPSALRTRHYQHTLSIDAPASCAPCFTHGHWPCAIARNQGKINSPCFSLIDPQTIDSAVDHLISQGKISAERRLLSLDPDRSPIAGSCSVCGHHTRTCGHPNFAYCSFCNSYSSLRAEDCYPDDFWHRFGDDTYLTDIAHWQRVCIHLEVPLKSLTATRMIDLAGGLGLFSAQVQAMLQLPCTLVDKCDVPSQFVTHDSAIGFEAIQMDVFQYLKEQRPEPSGQTLILCSHFIEHLELTSAVGFIRLLASRFPESHVCIYIPCAEIAYENEAGFLHFNTHYPGEHRIIWGYVAFRSLLRCCGVTLIDSALHDADAWYLCQL